MFVNTTSPTNISSGIYSTDILRINTTNNTIGDATNSGSSLTTISAIRIVIYSISLFLGFTGNSLVIIATFYNRKTLNRLRFLIAHLALTDIFFTFRLPFQFQLEVSNQRWDYGIAFCKIFHATNSMSMLASIGTMAVIAVERYRGITKPYLAKIKRSTLIISLLIVWTITILVYFPTLIFRQVKNQRCVENYNNVILQRSYSVIIFVAKYVFPLTIIGWCYHKIVRVIRNRPIVSGSQQKRRERDCNRTIQMLVVMVVAFALLTLPASIWWLLYDFNSFNATDWTMQIIEIFGTFVYLHSCVNPIIYCVMDKRFRADVVSVVKCRRASGNDCQSSKDMTNASFGRKMKFDSEIKLDGISSSGTYNSQNDLAK